MWQPGQKLGRFTLDREIGQGSHGVVWLATDTALGAQVAIKILHPWLTEDVPVRDRFKRELLLARRIAHPGICRLFDLHEEQGAFFITMDYVEGETLLSILKREGRLAPLRAARILKGVCSGLAAAHAAGVIHRDLKPANIIVRAGDAPMILDFGTATAGDVSRVTRPGTAVGSMRFIAPEIFTGTAPSISTDLYSLGVVAYVTIAGRLPYNAAAGAIEMLEMIRSQAPMRLDALEPDVPARLADVVARAMHREPSQRFASAQAFAEGLAEVEADLQRTEVNKTSPFTGDFARWAPSGIIRDAVKPEAAGKPVTPEASTSEVRPVMRPAGDGKTATSLVVDKGTSSSPSAAGNDAAADAGQDAGGDVGKAGAQVLADGKTEASFPNPFASALQPPTKNEKPNLTLPEPPPSAPSIMAANVEKTAVTAPPEVPVSGGGGDTVEQNSESFPGGAAIDTPSPTPPTSDVTVVVRPDGPLKLATFDPRTAETPAPARIGGFDRRLVLAAAAAGSALIIAVAVLMSGEDEKPSADAGTEVATLQADAGEAVVVVITDAGTLAELSDGGLNELVFEEPPEDDETTGAGTKVVRPKTTNPIDAEVKQVRLLMLKRGFWPGDLPAAEAALVKAKRAGRTGRTGEANKLIDQARAAIEKQNIDRAFVLAKLTRFNKKLDKSRQPQIANKVEPLAREAGQSFGAGDFDTANKKLNRAFALIGK